MNARIALYKHLQRFFEFDLYQHFRWSDVTHLPAEPATAPKGRVRNPLGRDREIVEVNFGAGHKYSLRVMSPVEAPPLGKVIFRSGGTAIEGVLSPETWKEIAAFIHKDHQKAYENV